MSDKPFSLIDSLLDETEPDWSSIGLQKPKKMGDQFKELTGGKTDDLLKQIGGDSRHTVVPGSRVAAGGMTTKPVNDAITGDTALADAFQTIGAVEKHTGLSESLSETEIKNKIKYLLSIGHKPSRIAGYIEKLAELKYFDKKQTAEYLKNEVGNLGLAYIEPNFYMNSCDSSYNEIKKKGSLRALSVKKIAACASCQHHRCGQCSLYGRPIVASAEELKKVTTAALTQKGIKTATLRSGLIQLHEGVGPKEVAELPYNRSTDAYVVRTAGDKTAKIRKEASAEELGKMISSGMPLNQVFKNASAQYGKASALNAVKRYIAGLKQSKARVILAALDCSYLKGKLAASNPIVGEKKCASCSYRNGMSCGLTGGTLLSFPGMDKVRSNRVAHEGVKDGQQVLFEYDLLDRQENSVEYRDEQIVDAPVEIDLTRSSQIDIED